MQVPGQGLVDALEPQNDDDAGILKVLQGFVWSNTLFKLMINTLDRWRHQKRLFRHHFDLSNFGLDPNS